MKRVVSSSADVESQVIDELLKSVIEITAKPGFESVFVWNVPVTPAALPEIGPIVTGEKVGLSFDHLKVKVLLALTPVTL